MLDAAPHASHAGEGVRRLLKRWALSWEKLVRSCEKVEMSAREAED
jgi:hypothetical protein